MNAYRVSAICQLFAGENAANGGIKTSYGIADVFKLIVVCDNAIIAEAVAKGRWLARNPINIKVEVLEEKAVVVRVDE